MRYLVFSVIRSSLIRLLIFIELKASKSTLGIITDNYYTDRGRLYNDYNFGKNSALEI